MGYCTSYDLKITPMPDLNRIESLGRARRALEREGLEHSEEIRVFFAFLVHEAIYQALFNDNMVFALGRGFKGGGESDSQWRTCEDDMRKLSAAAPDHLFTLSGSGEDDGDQWRKYFKGGRMQEARAKITFDEFDESKLV